jgi:hypothetical protein
MVSERLLKSGSESMASPTGTATVPFDAPELDALKALLVTASHVLDREGITDGYGHVSVRVPGADAFLTLASVSPGLAALDRLIMLDLDGNYLGGTRTPPNEWPIHASILRARPDVQSVCHTHSVWSTLFSVLPIKLRPLHHYGKFLPVGCINPSRSTVASGSDPLVLVDEPSQPIATENFFDTTGWPGGLPARQRWG